MWDEEKVVKYRCSFGLYSHTCAVCMYVCMYFDKHIHILNILYLLKWLVIPNRCHKSSCSGCWCPGCGAVVQHRSGNIQEEGTLLQGDVVQRTATHVPKIHRGASYIWRQL